MQLEFTVVVVSSYPALILWKGTAHGSVKQFGEWIMDSGPTSRAVGRSKEEEEEELRRFADFRTWLWQAVLAVLGYFMDKRPLQKHSKLSKNP